MARIQPFSEQTMVTGSRSTTASSGTTTAEGASPSLVRRLPSAVSGPKRFFSAAISSPIFFHCRSSSFSRPFRSFCSAVSWSRSCRISISSSLRRAFSFMLRMASAWTSVSFQRLIIIAFGSSSVRMILMTASRFR